MARRANGAGSIYKLTGNRVRPWVIRITTEWDGKRQKYKILGYFRTKEEAEIALQKYYDSGELKDTSLHGLGNTRIYRVWAGMIQRCENPKNISYKFYGAKGIKVCKEWRNSFPEFYAWSMTHGYTDELTIDRLNSDKDYCPENCRWATYLQQAETKKVNMLRKELEGSAK